MPIYMMMAGLKEGFVIAISSTCIVMQHLMTIEERARLRARARVCARGVLVEGGARMRAQARNADVSTKLNLPFSGVN